MDSKEWAEGKERLVATPSQFEVMLSRNCTLSLSPEVRLVLAILRQGASDAQDKYKQYLKSYIPKKGVKFSPLPAAHMLRSEEMSFWISGAAGLYAQLIGLDPDFVFEQFKKHLGIDIDGAKDIGSKFEGELREALSAATKGTSEAISAV